ncbi:energy-coupling factor transporter transmembrane protein EcfT [Suilimivivens aceti]|uniref:Energy-coupling factor transporter transmembrane protein EcfT n=1 Tax=Suilimivivens aceti TaxID=2981774 RepID=A0ABT2T0U2_9FIRM|nr:energy-coupling factor transporter transmembrane component T [Suilimivivens aceti]MCU6743881.1 energy-coupling factor transporter transmembrane protein EcfT [Suilimivivens aceti]SCH42391.1 Energy-coupling factor transporter transmembrane protein EcfT [uncultured Clostridium sp.]
MQNNKEQKNILNPLTNLYIILALAIISALFGNGTAIICVLVMIGIAFTYRTGKEYLKLWVKTIFFVTVVCFIFQILFIPGDTVIWKLWVFSITQEGLDKAVSLCSKILGIGSAAILSVKILNLNKLMAVLEKKGVSPTVSYVLMSTASIIPQMNKKMGTILEAQKSRGIEMESNLIVRAKAFFPSVGPLILNSIVSAEERAITLEARAFSAPCKKTTLHEIPDTGTDKAVRILAIAAVVAAIGGKIVLWIV